MVDIKHAELNDPSVGEFNQVVQDVRVTRERNDSRFPAYRHARSAEADIPLEESLPLFLSTLSDQYWQPTDQDASHQNNRHPGVRHRDNWHQGTRHQDNWHHAAWEADREGIEAVVSTTIPRRILKAGILAASVLAALVAWFTLEDCRALITKESASLAAVLPVFSSSIGRPSPAKEQIATTRPAPVAAAPTRQAIAAAYQTALQTHEETHQPPAAAPAARRLNPDELATLLKRARDLIDIGDFAAARLLLERAADAHDAKAAFVLAQTYDPAVLGTPDVRSIAPDPAAARRWYQKAVQWGSQEAQQRFSQMQN